MNVAAGPIAGGGAALLLLACSEPPRDTTSFALPSSLLEISGLAAAGPDSVFAHDDEHAIVHELDARDGRIMRSFALGRPTIEGDFEGIAAVDDQLFLITSDGLIYAFNPGEDRTRVGYRAHDTGIGPRCEIEGLSRSPDPEYLLILCKRLRREEAVPRLEIYRWRIGTEHADLDPWITVSLDQFLQPPDAAEFGPSGLEWDADGERLWIVSGRNRLLVEMDREGTALAIRSLDPARHRQAEGIAILPGCRLLLADEGTDTARARLSVYPCPSDPSGP